jgi:glyoxylase-like metal-dependent hydrolase (beta-lactamase superfamily II)
VPHDALRIGEIEVVPLCDSRVPFPLVQEFPVELEEGWEPYREAYPWAFLGNASWDYHVHAFAVRTSRELVLVDTGIGIGAPKEWGEVHGSLAGELALARIHPTDVDHVVHTHLHLDHIGGSTTEDGEPRFPFATHHVHLFDWEDAVDPQDPDGSAFERSNRSAFERCIRPIADRDLLDVTPEDREVVPGVRLLHAPGHTRGHRAVLIVSGAAELLLTGDALHHPFQVSHPEWPSTHDDDPEAGVETRTELLALARAGDRSVCVPHFARPFGCVEREGDERDRWRSL